MYFRVHLPILYISLNWDKGCFSNLTASVSFLPLHKTRLSCPFLDLQLAFPIWVTLSTITCTRLTSSSLWQIPQGNSLNEETLFWSMLTCAAEHHGKLVCCSKAVHFLVTRKERQIQDLPFKTHPVAYVSQTPTSYSFHYSPIVISNYESIKGLMSWLSQSPYGPITSQWLDLLGEDRIFNTWAFWRTSHIWNKARPSVVLSVHHVQRELSKPRGYASQCAFTAHVGFPVVLRDRSPAFLALRMAVGCDLARFS